MSTWYAQKGACNIDSVSSGTTSDVWNAAAAGGGAWMDTSVLTAATDDILVANAWTGIVVNIDINLGNGRLTTAAEGGTAGGTFTCSTGRTCTAGIKSGTSICLTTSGLNAMTWNFGTYGCRGGDSGSNIYGINVTQNQPWTITTTGAIAGGTGGTNAFGFGSAGTGAIGVTGGSVSGGSGGTRSHGIYGGGVFTLTLTNCNIINTAYGLGASGIGSLIYNPGAGNYIEYPKPTSGVYKYEKTYDGDDIIESSTQTGAAPETPNYHEATVAEVQDGVFFGPSSSLEGTYAGGGGVIVLED